MLHLTPELMKNLFHYIPPVLWRHRCSSTESLRPCSAANGHVSELYAGSALLLSCICHLWSITRCHTNATDVPSCWIPVEPSVCMKALHPVRDHQVKYNYPSNYIYLSHSTLLRQEPGSASNRSSLTTVFYKGAKCIPVILALSFRRSRKTYNLLESSVEITTPSAYSNSDSFQSE